jgi:hypothetical protein
MAWDGEAPLEKCVSTPGQRGSNSYSQYYEAILYLMGVEMRSAILLEMESASRKGAINCAESKRCNANNVHTYVSQSHT